MKLICVDVGNTNIDVAVMNDYNKEYGFEFPTIKEANLKYYIDEIKSGLKDYDLDAIISSVVPEINDNLVNAFSKLHINAKIVNPLSLEHLLRIGLKPKSCLGSDIYITALASIDDNDDASIVVDMGTATTIAVTYKGTVLGGIIYPGLKASYHNLFNLTSFLKEVPFSLPEKVIGDDTPSSIVSGMMYGTVGAIEKIVEEIRKEYRIKKLIFTGGAGRHFYSYFKGSTYDPDLIFKGLVKAEEYIRRKKC